MQKIQKMKEGKTMSVKEVIQELNEYFEIQKTSQELNQQINQLHSLIRSFSKETTLAEVLEEVMKELQQNNKEYDRLYKKYIEGQDYSRRDFPMLMYRNLNVATLALMEEQKLTFQDLESKTPYSAKKLEDVIRGNNYHEDAHAVYCVLCDLFGFDKQQYQLYTKVTSL